MIDVTDTRDPRVRKGCLDCAWYRAQLSRGDTSEITADISALFRTPPACGAPHAAHRSERTDMWKLGDPVRDVRTGAAGTIAQVTGPAPHIYRLAVPVPVGPPLALYRYGDELRSMPPTVGADAPPCSRYRVEVVEGRSYLIDPAGHRVHTPDGRAHWPDEPTAQAVADTFNG